MSSNLKPIKVWGQGGPNPPKAAFILEELGLPHEIIPISLAAIKEPEYLAINPNGRLPSIYDPNTDLTLWETGAIIEYLIERYDTEYKLSFKPGTPESYHAKQWLFFQTTGQGPYYGQAVWFKKFHPEQLPSAIERYTKEVNRVTHVLVGQLSRQSALSSGGDGPWLVGNKFSYADVAFITWQILVGMALDKKEYDVDGFPLVKDWIARMSAREKIAKVLATAFQPLT